MTTALGATATPNDDGFYFPADDARHAQMWLPWPRAVKLQKIVADLAKTVGRPPSTRPVVAPVAEDN